MLSEIDGWMPELDLLVTNARTREEVELVDIGVSRGKISLIGKGVEFKAKDIIDAKGNLVLPSFVDTHMHLDKAFLGEWESSVSGMYTNEVEKLKGLKKRFTISDVRNRSVKAIELAVLNGLTYIRTNVDVDTACGLTGLQGVLQAKQEMADVADVEIAAFPSQGILSDPGSEELLWKSMEMGADVVGGIPRLEADDSDSNRHTDIVFEIAKRFSADIDMHIDAICDPESRTIHYLAKKTILENYQGRVTAGHVVALSYYNDYYGANHQHDRTCWNSRRHLSSHDDDVRFQTG